MPFNTKESFKNISNTKKLKDIKGLKNCAAFLKETIGLSVTVKKIKIVKKSSSDGLLMVTPQTTDVLKYDIKPEQPLYVWVFAREASEEAGTLVFWKAKDGFPFFNKEAYSLNKETTKNSPVKNKTFWESSWAFFCEEDAYVLPQQVLETLEKGNPGNLSLSNKRVVMSLGLNMLHTWNLKDALGLFAPGPFEQYLGDTELTLLANEQPAGMLFTLLLEDISTQLDEYLVKFVKLDSISFSVFHSFASETFPTSFAKLSAQATLLSEPCLLEANLPSKGNTEEILSLDIYPQAPFGLVKKGGSKEGLSGLLTDLGIETDASVPDVFPELDLAISYLRVNLGDNSITSLSTELQLNLNDGDPDPGYEIVKDMFVMYNVSLQIDWMKGSGVSFVVSGAMNAMSYDFFLSFAYPSQVIQARLVPGVKTEKSIKTLAKEVGFPEVVGDGLAAVGTAFDISMYADIDDKQLEIGLQNHKEWKFANFISLSSFDLRLQFYNAWAFSGASLFVQIVLPIGKEKSGGSGREDVLIDVWADFDKTDNLWTFQGETDAGQDIAVGDAIAALVAKFSDAAHSEQLPEAIQSLVVRNISLYFDSKGNADFVCETALEIDGHEVDFWVHLKRENSTLQLAGSIFINGIQLAVAFSSKATDKYLVGSMIVPLTIDSRDIIAGLAPGLALDIPFHMAVQLKGLLLGMHMGNGSPEKGSTSRKEYLFRLSFNLELGLDGFPIIGKMLESLRFTNGQVLAANRDWQNTDIDSVNSLLSLIKPNQPVPIDKPKQANATVGVGKGISLSGTFQITEELGYPLFLHFGGGKKDNKSELQDGKKPAKGKEEKSLPSKEAGKPATKETTTPATGKADARSQSKIDQVFSAIRIKKVAMIFENGRLGLKITGGLSLAAFEFELMGLQVTVPQSVLNNPKDISDIEFGLDGFGAHIQKGALSITGAFLHHRLTKKNENDTPATKPDGTPATYDDYSGIIQVAFPPFNLTGMGSYAEYDGHTSLFLFVALGFPIPVHPSLLIEGMALGFGIHRDFIPPKLDEVLTYPLIQVCVTPPPPMDIQKMITSMGHYFPPTLDQYFVVAGIKFKAFSLVDTIAMLAVKFGRSFEIDLIGISSIQCPATFIELEWMARFVPEEGYLFIGGQLTSRSFLFIPEVQLTGGFAVAAWASGEHRGDFVVSVGGYHPRYKIPAHYPNHIPRLGISFELAPITIKGGVYFAVTPQCLMMGGFLEAALHEGPVNASLKMAMDAIILFEPFHYDLMIDAEAGVNIDIPAVFTTIHIHNHLHLDVHVWGPDFSGKAFMDVGPKTFDVNFGEGSSVKALPISWDKFRQKFLPTKDKICTVSVTEGLLRKVKVKKSDQTEITEVYVVDPKRVVIEAKSTIPIPDESNQALGIAPMDIQKFTAELSIENIDDFSQEKILNSVPAGIWGGSGLKKPDVGGSSDGLVKNVQSGFRLTPAKEIETSETHSIPKDKLAFNTDEFLPHDHSVARKMVKAGNTSTFAKPKETYHEYTGLSRENLTEVNIEDLWLTKILSYNVEENDA